MTEGSEIRYIQEDKAEWEIWYQDNFDLESQRQLEIAGNGLVKGLMELWVRHLYETISPTGGMSFSHFNLWCKKYKRSIKIEGDIKGLLRIRQWVFGKYGLYEKNYMEIADQEILNTIANVHWKLSRENKSSEPIVDVANKSKSAKDFISRINR